MNDLISLYLLVFGPLISFFVMTLTVPNLFLFPTERLPSAFRQRMIWEEFIRNNSKAYIQRSLRMSLASFNKLLAIIRPHIEVDRDMASLRGGAIEPEICLYITL